MFDIKILEKICYTEDSVTLHNMKFYFLFLLLIAFFASPTIAHAKDPKPTIRDATSYSAAYVSQSIADPIVIPAGSTKDVRVTFRNTGTATWSDTANRFVSAYTVEERYRASVFANSNWIGKEQPAKVAGTVAPGSTGVMTISLTAPTTSGTYREEFYLAAENYSWVSGGYFYLDIVVTAAEEDVSTSTPVDPPVTDTSKATHSGSVFFKNIKTVSEPGGTLITMKFAVRNTSDRAWSGLRLVNLGVPSVADGMWISSSHIANAHTTVDPGALYRGEVSFRTPPNMGEYQFILGFEADTQPIVGATITVPITVTRNAPSSYRTPTFHGNTASYRFPEETVIRVGIKKIEDEAYTTFTPIDDDYIVFAGGEEKGVLPKGVSARLRSDGAFYYYETPTLNFHGVSYIRLVPATSMRSIYQLGNFDRAVSWKGPRNFDTYRGAFEYRHADDNARTLYVIGEMGMEDYTAGIAEVSNGAPFEMQKAQAIVSRTYAEYIKDTTKHTIRHFDVVAHTGDQLFLGYESERITPQYVAAVQATRGLMVTHNDEIVITPYFGNSDGMTRSFNQVWGGTPKPWLVPVTAEYDSGKSLYGHGVGMSQRDAALRADAIGATYEDLIYHYYTGVSIERVYE
jgi:hypothetical protein